MSTLVQVRTQFIDISGRFDLATDPTGDDYTDNGADVYLQAGQDMLDEQVNFKKSVGRVWETIAADIYYVTFQHRCRAILDVFSNDDDVRTKLRKVDYNDLKNYYDDLIADTDSGEPVYYCPAFLRAMDATDKNATGTFFNHILADSDSYNGIILMPPPDSARDIEIKGLFYSDTLSAESDTNYWTAQHPLLYVWAALWALEISYRNTEGAKDWMSQIQFKLKNLWGDALEEELADSDQMEG